MNNLVCSEVCSSVCEGLHSDSYSSLPTLPSNTAFLIDDISNYLIDDLGNYLIADV